jgi:predicted DNA-binding ribbon-helix-helix protein
MGFGCGWRRQASCLFLDNEKLEDSKINSKREYGNLSSAIRLFVLKVYREQLELQDVRQKAIQRAIDSFHAGYS